MNAPCLMIDVHAGERLRFLGAPSSLSEVVIELVHKSGKLARLKITAPSSVKIEKTPENTNALPNFAPSMAR